ILRYMPSDLVPRLYTSETDERQAQLYLQRLMIEDFVVFHTGARKLLRRWALQKWADLAQALHTQYGWQVVFVGSAEDIGDIKRIQKLIPFETYNYDDQGSLMAYAALVAKSKLMVGNESGPMHIAASMQVPVIALFGPGQPDIFAPYGPKGDYLHVKLACNPCDQINCVHPENPCMNRILPEMVLDKVRTLLY